MASGKSTVKPPVGHRFGLMLRDARIPLAISDLIDGYSVSFIFENIKQGL